MGLQIFKNGLGYSYYLHISEIIHPMDLKEDIWYVIYDPEGITIGTGKDIQHLADFYGYNNFKAYEIVESDDPKVKIRN